MLKAIEHLDRGEAVRVLAAVADSLLPSPFDQSQSPYQELAEKILTELAERTRSGTGPPEARVMESLANELAAYLLPADKVGEVKARLGMRGDLAPRQYHVEVSRSFADSMNPLGIRPSHAIEAVRNPTDVVHLHPVPDAGVAAMSFYTKTIDHVKPAKRHILIVLAVREGASLRIDSAWRVFPGDVGCSDPHSPVELFRAFVEAFGLEFVVANEAPAKFVLYKKISLDETGSARIIQINNPLNHKFHGAQFFRRHKDFVEVAIVYIIDVTKYSESLQTHH